MSPSRKRGKVMSNTNMEIRNKSKNHNVRMTRTGRLLFRISVPFLFRACFGFRYSDFVIGPTTLSKAVDSDHG